ncbi:hypothetical protein VTJ49DRAFT_4047 [Mycothermus thermophilus]|uniref:Uncharacterized protein n=1 Tax=Humicola insolens TaxID=85995 RepID=A0ABR3V6B5_HUMIN
MLSPRIPYLPRGLSLVVAALVTEVHFAPVGDAHDLWAEVNSISARDLVAADGADPASTMNNTPSRP